MSVVIGVAARASRSPRPGSCAAPSARSSPGLQTLPSVAWVPAAIIWFGLTDAAIYAVVLLGAVPSIANGLLAGIDQVPPLYLRVGQVLGATRLDADPARAAARRAARLPRRAQAGLGVLVALADGRRAHRPLTALGIGLGQLLDLGRETSDMSLVIAAILLILLVGIAIELLVFAPLERHVLRTRGLTGQVSSR